MGCGKTFQGKSALRSLAQVQHYLNCLAAELESRVRATFTQHRRAPRLLVATHHCGYKTVKRKGVEFNLTSSGAAGPTTSSGSGMQGSRADMSAGGSKSCPFPGAADGSFTALAIARLAYDLIATAIGTYAEANAKWQCTALYITATSFFDLPSSAERIERFFAVAAAPPLPVEEVPRPSSHTLVKRASVIDETMLSELPPDIRADVERRRHEYERHCTFGSAMQPRSKKRRAATALDTFLVESTSAPVGVPARTAQVEGSTGGLAGAAAAARGANAKQHRHANNSRVTAPGVAEVAWEDVDESFLQALPLHIRAELKSRSRRSSGGGGTGGVTLSGALERKAKAKVKERGGKSIASFFK